MIMDLASLNGSTLPPRVADISAALRLDSRETDVYGWYRSPGALGAIYTALRGAERSAVQTALMAKTERALGEVFKPEQLRQIAVSFHFFPEDESKTDRDLYPDLKDRDKSKAPYLFLKRVIDVAGSLVGLVLFAPVLLVVAPLIKLTSDGPVLFKQRRLGRFGREFWFLKFRTMKVNNDPAIHEQFVKNLIENQVAQPTYKIQDDPRVTPVGRFLRKSSLDELPQLVNVIKGDMSLVGPRPPVPYEVANYRHWHRRRVIEVKPGITGLWQVEGRSRTTFDEMVRLDLRYIQHQSLWLDVKILAKTPLAVISGQGAW